MNKLLLYIIPILFFASCAKKKDTKTQAEICARLYPCQPSKDTIVMLDTVVKFSEPQYITKTEQVVIKGDTVTVVTVDTIYPIPIEKIITKTVYKRIIDSALNQVYKDNINALERRILDNDKEIGDLKLTVIKIKGNRTSWIISSISGWLIVLFFIAFFYYVWRHNQIKKEEAKKVITQI